MKRKTIVMQGRRVAIAACSLLIGASVMQSCKDDDVLTGQPDWLGNSIYEQLQNYGNYTTLLKLINDVDDNREVLSHTGSRTLFATNDSAYNAWFQTTTWKTATGAYVRKYEDLSPTQKKLLLKNSMLNNAYLVELMSNVSGNPPSEGRAMRRNSMTDIYDSITIMRPEEMPNSPYWDELRQRGKAVRIFKDNSRPTLMHFLPSYMKRNNFTLDDLSRLTNRPATSLEDAWVNGVKIVERDITCKNGYIHKVDGVIEASPNMAEIVHNHSEMSIWASLLDQFSAPYVRYVASTYDGNETQLAKFQRLYQTEDSVWALRYFSNQNDPSNTSSTHKPLNNKTDRGATVAKEELLNFDPGWNQYVYTNAAGEDLHYDAGAMIVPTDDAFRDWWNGEGKDLQDEYGTWDNMKKNIIASLINSNLLGNFNEYIPSKFNYILNDSKEQLGIKPENIVQTFMGCNGVVYMVDKVFAPAMFSSVMYPASAHSSLMGLVYKAIIDYDFKPYLISMDQDYSVFLPTNKALTYYLDPVYYGTQTPRIISFSYDDANKQIAASRWNVDIGDDGSITITSRSQASVNSSVIEDRLRDLIDQLIVVGDITSGYEFYKTKGGSFIRVTDANAGVNGMKVQGAWQIDHNATIPITDLVQEDGKTIDGIVTKKNGKSYLLDSIAPMTAEKSVYQTLKKHAGTAESVDDSYSVFYNLMNNDGCDLLLEKEGPATNRRTVAGDDNKNIRLFSNYNYTVYVPTNESIQKLVAEGKLPTWDDYSAQTADAWGGDEVLADTARTIIASIINEFLRYHIQDNALMLGARGNGKNHTDSVHYESMMRDPETGRFFQMTVWQTGTNAQNATLKVMDLQGNIRNVKKTAGLFNNICREYWFKGTGNDAEIYFVSSAVVHQIDGPLLYKQLRPWREILNELKK